MDTYADIQIYRERQTEGQMERDLCTGSLLKSLQQSQQDTLSPGAEMESMRLINLAVIQILDLFPLASKGVRYQGL